MSKIAWYDPGDKFPRWLRDLWVLSHPSYTLWHLSYIPIGAALAPALNWSLLGWTLLAFFLGMGVAAHCLDELHGRPLKTTIPSPVLKAVALVALAGAVGIGVFVGVRETLWVIPCILFGVFIALAYNLEWPSGYGLGGDWWVLEVIPQGFFHRDRFFGLAWGAFPLATSYLAQAHTLSAPVIILGIFALVYSLAQRTLSKHARFWRRRVAFLSAHYALNGEPVAMGFAHDLTKQDIFGPAEGALQLMTWAVVALAVGLLLWRLL